jgi:hypothetical protein
MIAVLGWIKILAWDENNSIIYFTITEAFPRVSNFFPNSFLLIGLACFQ